MSHPVVGRLVGGLGSLLVLTLLVATAVGLASLSGLDPAAVRVGWLVGLVLAPVVLVAVELGLAGLLAHVGGDRS